MKVKIRVQTPEGIISHFEITGEVTELNCGDASREAAFAAVSGHLFQMEYAINEHVPKLRVHISVGEEL